MKKNDLVLIQKTFTHWSMPYVSVISVSEMLSCNSAPYLPIQVDGEEMASSMNRFPLLTSNSSVNSKLHLIYSADFTVL